MLKEKEKEKEIKNIIFKGWKMSYKDFMHLTNNGTKRDISIGVIFNYMSRYDKDYEMSLKG